MNSARMLRASALLLLAAAACSQALPPQPAASALYRDLQRMVRVRQTAPGWRIDRLALEGLEEDALDSTCRATPEARAAVLAWIDVEIAKRGGAVDEAWRREGKELDRVGTLLELTRIRMLLARAADSAPRDCPFWIEPGEGFRGRQISDDRWRIVIEGGGKGILLRSGGATELSAGGAGRALVGRSFGTRLDLMTGVELGLSAAFPRDAGGERGGLVLALDYVVPVVVRWRSVNTYIEAEAGWLGRDTEGQRGVVSGLHVGLGVGFKALRTRWFIPGVAYGMFYERTLPGDGSPPLHLIKAGLRVTLDFDL
jgi:hypothetical protein